MVSNCVSSATAALPALVNGDSFLSRLDDWYQREKNPVAGLEGIPYAGGWFVYLGYELAAEIEPTVQFPAADDGFPVAFASRCPAVILSTPDQPGMFYSCSQRALNCWNRFARKLKV